MFLGRVLSRTAVNRVSLAVQSQMAAWRQQPITDTPPLLIIAGVWGTMLYPTGVMWTDRSGHERQEVRGQERVILTALAVWPDGRHHILWQRGAEEAAELQGLGDLQPRRRNHRRQWEPRATKGGADG